MMQALINDITRDMLDYTPLSAASIESRLEHLQNTMPRVSPTRCVMEDAVFADRLSALTNDRSATVASDICKVRIWFFNYILTDIQLGFVAETLLDKYMGVGSIY